MILIRSTHEKGDVLALGLFHYSLWLALKALNYSLSERIILVSFDVNIIRGKELLEI